FRDVRSQLCLLLCCLIGVGNGISGIALDDKSISSYESLQPPIALISTGYFLPLIWVALFQCLTAEHFPLKAGKSRGQRSEHETPLLRRRRRCQGSNRCAFRALERLSATCE